MLILAADTSGKNGSLALVRFDGAEEQILDLMPLEGGTFSAQLVPQIAAMLQKHGVSKGSIDAFAVVSGPGSFTGLRVGLAAIKALAEVLDKPIAAVSLLEAVARASDVSLQQGRPIVAALDAGRSEIYTGEFESSRFRLKLAEQSLQSMQEFVSRSDGKAVVATDSKLAETFRSAGLAVTLIPPPKADAIARLGFEKIQSGEGLAPDVLDATYIRRSDAEIKLGK